jgi:hypothetical protein
MSNYDVVKEFSEIPETSVFVTTQIGAQVAFLLQKVRLGPFDIHYGIVYGWEHSHMCVHIIDQDDVEYRIERSRVKRIG